MSRVTDCALIGSYARHFAASNGVVAGLINPFLVVCSLSATFQIVAALRIERLTYLNIIILASTIRQLSATAVDTM